MRTSRALAFASVTVVGLLLAGCSSNPATTAPSTISTTSGATTVVSPQAAAQPTAAQIVAKFKTASLPVGTTITYTAADDPNHLLGRPNGYTSKTAWTDTRVDPTQAKDTTPGSVDLGGSVEVYTTAGDATAREAYIQSELKANPMLGTEYDFVVGDALVRVSSLLTPAQAQAYEGAAKG